MSKKIKAVAMSLDAIVILIIAGLVAVIGGFERLAHRPERRRDIDDDGDA